MANTSALKCLRVASQSGLTACGSNLSSGDESLGAKLQGSVADYSIVSISVAALRINDYLKWSLPLRNPMYASERITMRQLVLHTSGIVSDSTAGYDTYPKPDPNGDLDAYLRPLLAQPKYWGSARPETAKTYSNLGVALAALVVERVTGWPFNTYCNENLFMPLGMNDARWFFRELEPAQQDRIAIPYQGARDTQVRLPHYGFEDWPSGQMRSTAVDYTRPLAMVMVGGAPLLSQSSLGTFEAVPLLMMCQEGPSATAVGRLE